MRYVAIPRIRRSSSSLVWQWRCVDGLHLVGVRCDTLLSEQVTKALLTDDSPSFSLSWFSFVALTDCMLSTKMSSEYGIAMLSLFSKVFRAC